MILQPVTVSCIRAASLRLLRSTTSLKSNPIRIAERQRRHCSPLCREYFSRLIAMGNSESKTEAAHEDHVVAEEILDFWFGAGTASWRDASEWDPLTQYLSLWMEKSDATDATIRSKFGKHIDRLLDGTYSHWKDASAPFDHKMAYILLGDQFCRNVHRNSAKMYEADPLVLPLAKRLVHDKVPMPLFQKFFALLPLMHSESVEDQRECVAQFETLLDAAQKANEEAAVAFLTNTITYAIAHCDIVEQYGRFPHRNAILGRENTPEEASGLAKGTIQSF